MVSPTQAGDESRDPGVEPSDGVPPRRPARLPRRQGQLGHAGPQAAGRHHCGAEHGALAAPDHQDLSAGPGGGLHPAAQTGPDTAPQAPTAC